MSGSIGPDVCPGAMITAYRGLARHLERLELDYCCGVEMIELTKHIDDDAPAPWVSMDVAELRSLTSRCTSPADGCGCDRPPATPSPSSRSAPTSRRATT